MGWEQISLKDGDAAVVYICGQSNAHAHGQTLMDAEAINHGCKHVFTLDPRIGKNLADPSIVWRQYTSQYNNLGEHQDNTCTLGWYIAKTWETRIAQGEQLPDLYIVQISIGGQGILNGLWNMELPAEADGPLYPLAMHVLPAVEKDLRARYQKPIAIGFHWIGSESDTDQPYSSLPSFRRIYDRFFDSILAAVGFACPLFLYKLLFYRNETACISGIEMVNQIFAAYTQKYAPCYLVDCTRSPLWDASHPNLGIFAPDNIHYLGRTQRWFGERFLEFLGLCPEQAGQAAQ